jgi:hypothetical protein
MKKVLLPILTVVVVTGCASQVVDNSPKVTGAVVKAEYSINGQILPDFTGEQTVHTLGNKRSIRDTIKFDSFIMRWANSDKADIARIDLNKAYDVNYKSEKYSECPLDGCAPVSFLEEFKTQEGDEAEDEYQDYETLGCTVDMVNNDFSVNQTGAKRKLNGFDVEQYTVLWVVEYQDKTGAKDLNQISFDFWTTNPDAAMNNVWNVHGQFQDAIAKTAATDPLIQLLGENGYKALAAFTGDTDNQKNQFGGEIGKKLASIEGYPISIKLEWVRKSEACQEEKAAVSASLDVTGGLEDMGKQLLGNLAKKGSDALLENWKKEPLVRYVYEIKSVAMQDVRESVFDVSAGFDLVNRQ